MSENEEMAGAFLSKFGIYMIAKNHLVPLTCKKIGVGKGEFTYINPEGEIRYIKNAFEELIFSPEAATFSFQINNDMYGDPEKISFLWEADTIAVTAVDDTMAISGLNNQKFKPKTHRSYPISGIYTFEVNVYSVVTIH